MLKQMITFHQLSVSVETYAQNPLINMYGWILQNGFQVIYIF